MKAKKKIYNVSKRLGDKLGLDLPYFVENGFWVLFNQGVTILFAFFLSIVFARYLEKETYGQYQLIISIISIISVVSLTGLNVSITRAVAQGFLSNYRRDIKTSLKWSFIGMPILAVVGSWYFLYDDQNVAYALFLSTLFFPLIYSSEKWRTYFRGKAQFESLARRNILQSSLIYGSLIFTAVLFKDQLFLLIGIYLILTAGLNTLWHLMNLRNIKHLQLEKKYDSEALPYGKFITKLNILTLIVTHFDKILIGFLDIRLLAVYVIAIKLINIVKSVTKSFYSISFPKFAKSSIRIASGKILMIMCLGLAASFILYFIADPIINFLYTAKYSESVDFFKKLIFILPFTFVNPLFNQKIHAQKDKRKILMVGLHVPIVSIVISVLVFIISKDIELFIMAKVYIQTVSLFIVLMPWFIKERV